MTDILGIVPDRSVQRGADRVPPRGSPRDYGWHVSCRDDDEVLAENMLIKVLDRVSSILPNLDTLRGRSPDAEVKFVVIVDARPEDVALYLSSATTKRIAQFNASLDIAFERRD